MHCFSGIAKNIRKRLYKMMMVSDMRMNETTQIISRKGRTIRYLGGGPIAFVACKFFFYLREKTIFFFWRSTSDDFFYVSSKKFFVVCFPYYVRYHLVFFLVNILFINFDNKLFFLPTFSTNFFFVATNYFFLAPPPPPDIK